MKKMRFRRKNVKSILSAILVVAVVVGVFAGLNSLSERDLKTVHPVFTVGGLNEEGKYVESDGTIYTKEAFECQGLEIKLDFEKTIFYEVYFYDENGYFISSTDKSNENSKPTLPSGVTHARIVITPDWDLLEVNNKKDQVVKWYEVAKYANQIEIKVNEEQYEYEFVFEEVALTDSAYFTLDEGCYYMSSGERKESTEYNSYIFVATGKCKFYMESGAEHAQYVIENSDGFVRYQKTDGTWLEGEENTFDLNKGDKVYISLRSTHNAVDMTYFYLGTYGLNEK